MLQLNHGSVLPHYNHVSSREKDGATAQARESSRLRDSSLSSLSDGLFQLFPTHTPTKLVRTSLAATASSMGTSSSNPTSLGGPRLFYPALRTAIHYAVTAQPQRPYKMARGRLGQSLTIPRHYLLRLSPSSPRLPS